VSQDFAPDHIELITCQTAAHAVGPAQTAHWRLWTRFTVNYFCTDCVIRNNMVERMEEGWKLESDFHGFLHTGQEIYRQMN
jgi:hypothetical protein